MDVTPIVDALLPQPHDRALLEHLVAAYERLEPIHLPPNNKDIWSARDEVCARVKAEGRGDAVLRAVHAALPASIEGLQKFARFVADHGDGSYESSRSFALTPVSVTHLVELVKLVGVQHLADVAAWLWLADEAALARLQPIVRAQAAAFTKALAGVSSGDGEARAFELFAVAFSDEGAALRHVAKVTGPPRASAACAAPPPRGSLGATTSRFPRRRRARVGTAASSRRASPSGGSSTPSIRPTRRCSPRSRRRCSRASGTASASASPRASSAAGTRRSR